MKHTSKAHKHRAIILMIKKIKHIAILLPIAIYLWSPLAHAKEILTGGTLQAYWAENWNDEGTVNKPYLGLKYLPADKKKFIVLSIKGSKATFIKNNFKNIPSDFFTRKEWYITQQGDLTIDKIKEGMLCNGYTYDAKVIAFKPDINSSPVDTAPYEGTAAGGCNGDGRYPYLTEYIRKDNSISIEFKSSPNLQGEKIAKKDVDTIVKIRKINKHWIYVGVYDDESPTLISPPYGYVNTENLEILN